MFLSLLCPGLFPHKYAIWSILVLTREIGKASSTGKSLNVQNFRTLLWQSFPTQDHLRLWKSPSSVIKGTDGRSHLQKKQNTHLEDRCIDFQESFSGMLQVRHQEDSRLMENTAFFPPVQHSNLCFHSLCWLGREKPRSVLPALNSHLVHFCGMHTSYLLPSACKTTCKKLLASCRCLWRLLQIWASFSPRQAKHVLPHYVLMWARPRLLTQTQCNLFNPPLSWADKAWPPNTLLHLT